MSNEGVICKHYISLALFEHELPTSESAIRLLCMIAAHESGSFKYSRQIRGPALGLLQMEPGTFFDVSDYARRKGLLCSLLPADPREMIFNFPLSVAMGRVFFLRIPEALPAENDIKGLATYAKRYWNTELGKATADDYLEAYQLHFSDN